MHPQRLIALYSKPKTILLFTVFIRSHTSPNDVFNLFSPPRSPPELTAPFEHPELLEEVSSTIPDIHERTLVMIKPDGVQRGLVGKIISRFEEKGFKLVAMKFMKAEKDMARLHRSDKPKHMVEPIFSFVVDYLTMGPVVPMVFEGHDIIR